MIDHYQALIQVLSRFILEVPDFVPQMQAQTMILQAQALQARARASIQELYALQD